VFSSSFFWRTGGARPYWIYVKNKKESKAVTGPTTKKGVGKATRRTSNQKKREEGSTKHKKMNFFIFLLVF
jgi:hypothetical protein